MAKCTKCLRSFLTEWPIVCQIFDCPQISVREHMRRLNEETNRRLLEDLEARETALDRI